MKKIRLLIGLCMSGLVFISTSLKAQDQPQAGSPAGSQVGLHIGATFQPTLTSFDINDANGKVEGKFVLGYGFGGSLGYLFSNNFETRLEVLYSSLAQNYNQGDRKIKLSYLNFPLLAVLHTDYDAPISLNIAAGPQVGIKTGASIAGNTDMGNGSDTVQFTGIFKAKPVNFGFAYGAGLDFALGLERAVHLNLGFRGVYGLIDISDKSQTQVTNQFYILDRSKVKTYSGYLGISYRF